MEWFYCLLSEPKVVHGPVGIEALEALIADGRLRSFDLITRASENWLPIEEWQSLFLAGHFDSSTENSFSQGYSQIHLRSHRAQRQKLAARRALDWVFMDESGRIHGPYDESSAIGMVRQGKVSFFDWAWCSGDTNWTRVRDCEIFERTDGTRESRARVVAESGVVSELVPETSWGSKLEVTAEVEGCREARTTEGQGASEQMSEIFIAKPRELFGVERDQRAAIALELQQRATDRQKPDEACGEDLLEDSYWEKGY